MIQEFFGKNNCKRFSYTYYTGALVMFSMWSSRAENCEVLKLLRRGNALSTAADKGLIALKGSST